MKTSAKDPFKTLVKILLIMLVVIIAVFVLPKVVSCIMPFFLAWIVSMVIKPIVKFFEKLHLNRRISVILSMLLVICLIFGLVYVVSGIVIREVTDAVELLGQTRDGIPLFLWDVIDVLPGVVQNAVIKIIKGFGTDWPSMASTAVKSFLPQIGGFAGKLPGAFVFTVVFIIAIYFMTYDPDSFKSEIKRLVPPDKYSYLFTLKQSFKSACGGYIRAQLIIMSIVFCILLVGFLIMDVRFALLLAFVISIIDAVPVMGTGMVLNPWAVVCLLQGNFVQAVGLASLYVIILVTRQFIEPRILSGQLGIHPLITLVSMYAGLKIVGIFGMILGPLIAIIIVSFIKINREKAEDKEEEINVG